MPNEFWFNRIIEYWSLPRASEVVEHVRRAKVQVVQMGNFGPDFYSLAEDAGVARSWVGMPLIGTVANLTQAADLVPQLQAEGARVVGQLSMTMFFGDHEKGLGLFGSNWERIWTDDILGPAPCGNVEAVIQREVDGSIRCSFVEGRPYYTYKGCICNPGWLAVLKTMIDKGLEVGLDGFNATHNYESFCHCMYCAEHVRQALAGEGAFTPTELRTLFDGAELEEVRDLLSPGESCPADLRERFERVLHKAAAHRRKAAFDEVFIAHGRSIKPDLLLAQWYHKYDLRADDERSALPTSLWAKGEDYIWYSQGPYKWGSSINQGYLSDMGLPARFMYAAGGGRPFVVNKYDYRRWRVWSAEAAAHGGAALAFHAGPPRVEQEDQTRVAPEDYYGPVIRYQRFLAEHEHLLHPATPWSRVALVYPRRLEREGDADCLDVLKRVGEWLEDGHVLFDIILDEQLNVRAESYETLILPDVQRLSQDELALLERHVASGGSLVLTGSTGFLDVDGQPHAPEPLKAWRMPPENGQIGSRPEAGSGRVFYVPEGPWKPETIPIWTLNNVEMPVYSRLGDDSFGRAFLDELVRVSGGQELWTDAPWLVRVRAWRPEEAHTLVLHWINYLQDDEAAIEVPIPVGPLQVAYRLPDGVDVERVEWCYPEMARPTVLEHTVESGEIRFSIPRLIVYGMSVLWLQDG
ncbi:MAG: hypothetical protein O2954_01710 [bacterium]|nr:hypothetical protein [bacterium]